MKKEQKMGAEARSLTDDGQARSQSGNESLLYGKERIKRSKLRGTLQSHLRTVNSVTHDILNARLGNGLSAADKLITADMRSMMAVNGLTLSANGLQDITEPENLSKSLLQAAKLVSQLSHFKSQQKEQVKQLKKDMVVIEKIRRQDVVDHVKDGNILGTIQTSVVNAVKNNSDQQNIQRAESAVNQTEQSISAANEVQSRIAAQMGKSGGH